MNTPPSTVKRPIPIRVFCKNIPENARLQNLEGQINPGIICPSGSWGTPYFIGNFILADKNPLNNFGGFL